MSSKKELTNGKYIDDQMGNGVPEGGTTGQVLKKNSNDDYDVVWGTGGGGGGSAVWGGITGTVTDQTDLTSYISGLYTPFTRTLTINGVSYDLSANRSWTIDSLPSQTGNTGKWLKTDGSVTSWQNLSGNISLFTNNVGYLTSSTAGSLYYPLSSNPANYLTSTSAGLLYYPLSSNPASYLTTTLAASTYEPTITAGTTSQYWRGDKTWQNFPTIPAAQIQSDWNQTNNTALDYIKNKPTIPTVGTWGALNYPTWTAGTPFVKMTAAGTFSLDTNIYLTGITSSDVTTALGYTPYDATNPSGYITSSALSPYLTSSTAASTYTPLTRTITINGISYDLSANRSWTISSTTSPSGSDGQIQYNNSGTFGASSSLFWDKNNKRLGIGINTPYASLHIKNGTGSATYGLEQAIFESTGDNKVGIYSNSNFGYSTSLVLGNFGQLDTDGYYPSMEMKFQPYTNPDNSYLTFDLVHRDINGNFFSKKPGIFTILGDGTIQMSYLQNSTKSYVVGYDPTNGYLTYQSVSSGSAVQSVTGLNTDNTDPLNPIVKISVDGTSITGDGTPGNPLVSTGGGGGGTVYVDGVTIAGNGSSSTVLRTIQNVYYNIDLTAGSYYATTEGVYNVYNTPDPLSSSNYFYLPDPSANNMQGKRIVIINKSTVDSNFPVLIQCSSASIYYRDTNVICDIVPNGAAYEFVSTRAAYNGQYFWSNISPVDVVYTGVDLSGKYKPFSYGVYVIDVSDTNNFNFPNPAYFTGQTITIINKATNYSVYTNCLDFPIYYQGSSVNFTEIPLKSIVEFISDGSAWRSKPSTAELIVANNLDLRNNGDYHIPIPGIYQVSLGGNGAYTLFFPDGSQSGDGKALTGHTITVINDSGDYTHCGNNVIYPGVGGLGYVYITDLKPYSITVFKCLGETWMLVSELVNPSLP